MASIELKPFKILVLSDLHFGSLSVSAEFALASEPPPGIMTHSVSMKESLIQVATNERIDAILVAGDLTSGGNPQEFVGCMNVLSEIASRLGVNPENIVYTYGNHDVDWQITKIPEETSSAPLKDLYLKIGASVGDVLLQPIKYQEKGPVPGCGLVESDFFRIYTVNSGYYCSHNQNYRHGKLGEEQRLWLEQKLNYPLAKDKWHVLLMHHHPFPYRYPFHVEDISCLEEGAEFIEVIGKAGVDLVCHGHRHHPILFTAMRTGWRSPVTMLCAGSFAVNEQHRCRGEIPNLFHIVSLEHRIPNGAAAGRVKSFQYGSAVGWHPVKYDAQVPLDAIQRFADVYDASTMDIDMSQVLRCIEPEDDQVHDLPGYSELPLSLQCMPIKDLNEMVRRLLLEKNYKMIGMFPESVVVRRSRDA